MYMYMYTHKHNNEKKEKRGSYVVVNDKERFKSSLVDFIDSFMKYIVFRVTPNNNLGSNKRSYEPFPVVYFPFHFYCIVLKQIY